MSKKRPFHVTFSNDRTVIFNDNELPRSDDGIAHFGTSTRRNLIEEHAPEMLNKYDEGIEAFNKRWNSIESRIL